MKDFVSQFPEVFLRFLSENNVDLSLYVGALNVPRYFRISGLKNSKGTHHELIIDDISRHIASQLDIPEETAKSLMERVPGMEHLRFYRIMPGSLKLNLASSRSFRSLNAFGMDIGSALAVDLLCIQPGDHILDLCCAPGAKLALLHELGDLIGNGTITGVDISEPRLHRVRNLCRKMGYQRIRLFLQDGTTFSTRPCDVVSL
jgi:16S rRNA C967 or C1407 C5-methylase (RsmB/RsmF family)